jgi:LysR family glycine cleavage system transcriptional activator
MNPNWQILETFVLIARLGSMKAAAARLSLTASAISQRIQALETMSGARLFIRTRSGITLTPEGDALFRSLDAPFQAIDVAWREIEERARQRGRRRQLVISAMPSFASHVLVPRLGRFSARHPEIEVTIETDLRLVDLVTEPVDLAIRHGLGDYPGLKSTWLMSPELIVVASPDLLRRYPPPKTPADCLGLPLLHDHARRDWRLWLAAHGVTPPAHLKGPAFSDDTLLSRAAAAGQGLALVRDFYAREELGAGNLIQALDLSWPTRFAYYAVATPDALRRPAVRQFRDWLVAELGDQQPQKIGRRSA